MIHRFLFGLFVYMCAVLCLGASAPPELQQKSGQQKSRPNLSGTWKLDNSNRDSLYAEFKSKNDVVVLEISQQDPEIKFTYRATLKGREITGEKIYYSDGRGETNRTIFDMPPFDIITET